MNKTLYSTAMDQITMSEQCENSIIEAAVNAAPAENKKRGKIRFIPVLAAAAVLVTGTVTAAADGFNWVKGFFENKEFEITNDVSELMGEIDNFSYESNTGIKLSPIGMLADESTLYCMFHLDEKPSGVEAENLEIGLLYTDKTTREIQDDNFFDFGDMDDCNSSMECYAENKDDIFIFKIFAGTKKVFSNGENITARFDNYKRNTMERTGDYIKVNFDINNVNSVKAIEINFDDPVKAKMMTDNVTLNGLYITPFKIYSTGSTVDTKYPFENYVNANLDTGLEITMKDGKTTVNTTYCGWSSTYINGDEHSYSIDWDTDEPINPENISTIYLQDVCIYDASASY